MTRTDSTLAMIDVPANRPLAPRISVQTQHFWNALAQGHFEVSQCKACEHLSFPPKGHCPQCGAGEVAWRRLSGKGMLYSQTTQYAGASQFQAELPYTLGIVDTEEGVRILTRLLNSGVEPQLDQPVELVVLRYLDGPLFAARAINPEVK